MNETVALAPPPFARPQINFAVLTAANVFDSRIQQTTMVQNVLIRVSRPGEEDDEDSISSEDSNTIELSENRVSKRISNRAYLLLDRICNCIFGVVRRAVLLSRRHVDGDHIEWELTGYICAVKEMSWERIRAGRNVQRENPIDEISAMQYITRSLLGRQQQDPLPDDPEELQPLMQGSHLLLPIDCLADNRNVYSVLPNCDGGELFAYLEDAETGRLSEPQARYWIRQILDGIRALQDCGICHRDISLENVLIHGNNCYIMDFGMSCRIPYINGERILTLACGAMGKWPYMAPEIANNRNFDGHAVDLWAVGVMLFFMVTGNQPWERPYRTDEHFRYMSGGYLVQILTEWDFGLSEDVKNLMQNMLYYEPGDRFSFEQVLGHPWLEGEVEEPNTRPGWANAQ